MHIIQIIYTKRGRDRMRGWMWAKKGDDSQGNNAAIRNTIPNNIQY